MSRTPQSSSVSRSRQSSGPSPGDRYRLQLSRSNLIKLVRYGQYENFNLESDQRVYQVCNGFESELLTCVDQEIISELNADYRDKLPKQDNGYHNLEIVLYSMKLFSENVSFMRGWVEADWKVFFCSHLWDRFRLRVLFSYTTWEQCWRPYDPALTRIDRRRAGLVKPKPSYAFGIHFSSDSETDSETVTMLEDWQEISSPSVNLFVHDSLAVPFFIYESKGRDGGLVSAENQIFNGMRQAHDILSSLNLQKSLHVFGMAQIGTIVHMYISFGIDATSRDERYCKQIHVSKLGSILDLEQLKDLLTCLRFVEQVQRYGLDTFTPAVMQALVMGSVPNVPDTKTVESLVSSST